MARPSIPAGAPNCNPNIVQLGINGAEPYKLATDSWIRYTAANKVALASKMQRQRRVLVVIRIPENKPKFCDAKTALEKIAIGFTALTNEFDFEMILQ